MQLLTLIPATVNGTPFTLSRLRGLVQQPMGGGRGTDYHIYWEKAEQEIGGRSVQASYWALMTREPIPGSENKTMKQQEDLIKSYRAKVLALRGGLPTVLEATTSIMMEYVSTGKRLYSDSQEVAIRCADIVNTNSRVRVGYFSSCGLKVYDSRSAAADNVGIACVWKV